MPGYRRPIKLNKSDILRFWNKVARGKPNECWEWQAARLEPGYGIFMTKGNTTLRANRIALTLSKGPIPTGLDACHTCDNPPCCNPNHLFYGTMQRNLQDASAKNRCAVQRHPEIVRGERNGSAKLTEKEVRAIRCKSESITQAATRYSVSITIIKRIRNRTLWTHVLD
jgi:hypothetical protein